MDHPNKKLVMNTVSLFYVKHVNVHLQSSYHFEAVAHQAME
jgi:hypothetical protein